MDIFTVINVYWSQILLSIIMTCVLLLVIFLLSICKMHHEIESKTKAIPAELNNISHNLRTISRIVSKGTHNTQGSEKEVVMEEVEKITQLWKSRREQLKMGYWEKMEARADELDKLREEKEQIEELIRRTKVKYHKRELDEESFREIVKDYQKQLMEINVRIWELEKRLG